MTDATAPRGEIYDLGYRHYDGARLGRGYAVRSLIALSIRTTFGLGRGALPKVMAFGLTALAFIPAIGVVIGGAVAGGIGFEFVRHDEYFGLIQTIIVLFVAAMASELVGNDRKNNTLPLYFSRPITRDDYVFAKVASLAAALLALTLGPQLLVFIGNWLGAPDGGAWLRDNISDLWRVVVASVLVCGQLAAIGIAIAMFTTRRAMALTAVLVTLLTSLAATNILGTVLDRGPASAVMVLSPLTTMQAVNLHVFDAVPPLTRFSSQGELDDLIAFTELPSWAWLVALVVQAGLAVAFALRRYRRSV